MVYRIRYLLVESSHILITDQLWDQDPHLLTLSQVDDHHFLEHTSQSWRENLQEDPIFGEEKPEKPRFPSDFPVSLPGEGTSIAPGQRAAAGPGQVKGEGCGPAWSCRRFLKTWKTPSKPSDFVRFPECSLDLSRFECWSIWLSHVFSQFFGEVERSKQWFVSVVNLRCQLTKETRSLEIGKDNLMAAVTCWRVYQSSWLGKSRRVLTIFEWDEGWFFRVMLDVDESNGYYFWIFWMHILP